LKETERFDGREVSTYPWPVPSLNSSPLKKNEFFRYQYGQKIQNPLSLMDLPRNLSTPLPLVRALPDTPQQKEHYHQERENESLMPLATQEGVGTHSIHAREKLGGLLEYYSRETA
jgi:hypothetical protein